MSDFQIHGPIWHSTASSYTHGVFNSVPTDPFCGYKCHPYNLQHKLVLLKIFDRGTKRALTSVSALDFPLDNNSFSSQRIPVGYSPSVFFSCQRDLTAVVSSFIYI
jgi:hypothetical protein